MSLARDYIELTELWENTDKDFMIDNIERIIGHPTSKDIDYLAKITNVSNHTVLAWFNRSRNNVKIPLIKLCILADYFNVDIKSILSQKLTRNRNWNSYITISDRQKLMFQRINEADFFHDGSWDLQGLIRYMDSIEDYKTEDGKSLRFAHDRSRQLSKDCNAYLECITNSKTGIFMDEIREQVVQFFNKR